MQSRRMDEQRADLPACDLELPGFSGSKDFIQRLSVASDADGLPDDQFFDMLIRCQVRTEADGRVVDAPKGPLLTREPEERERNTEEGGGEKVGHLMGVLGGFV